jgi:hypothetical protein
MSADLEPRDHDLTRTLARADRHPELLLPFTGELVDLRDPAQVAHALDQVRDAKRRLDELRTLLEELLRAESQRQGTKTVHLDGGLTAVVSGGSRAVYDGEQLGHDLEQAGLPAVRLVQAVHPLVEWKGDARVVKQLEASNPAYAAAIARARRIEPAAWRVTVKR